jgi:hypothetical protein
MNNKRVLSKIKMGNSVKPNPYNKDIIVDPMGQWNHPGKNTRIPSDRITMKGVNYPVLGVSNTGQKQMMQPGREYNFPGANYVDEYPQMANGGTPCPSGQKVYPDFKDFGCLTESQYASLKQQKTEYINKRNAASKHILDLKNAGKFNDFLQEVKNYQTQYPNQSYVCPGPNCPNEVLKVPKNIIIKPPKPKVTLPPPKNTPIPPINPVIKEPIELPIIDPPLLENKNIGELRTPNFTVSDPIEAPQYTLEPYTADRMRLDVKLPQNKLKSWFDKGVIDTKGHIGLGKRNETRLIPKIVQKVTGYDPAYFEGYEDEEGNFVPGELDYGNATGSEIEFKGAASLRDFMNQKKYKKEYEEYDKKLDDWNEKYEQSKKKQEEGQAFKKGGAKKKYTSDIINSTNYLFAEHPLFKKKKQSKKRIYSPNAKYYAYGGESGCPDGYTFNPITGECIEWNPTVWNSEEQPTSFDPIADIIYMNPNDRPEGMSDEEYDQMYKDQLEHEQLHRLQWINDGLKGESKTPLRMPSTVDNQDYPGDHYYNRRQEEVNYLHDYWKNQHPDEAEFIPDEIIYDKETNPAMYELPWTVEGEARDYENATHSGMESFFPKRKKGGALLTKKVTCKKCGWTWDAADGGNDMTTCHKCGGQGLIHAQNGGYINDISISTLTKASYGYSVGNLIRKQDGGTQTYTYQGRPGSYYKKDADGKWMIKNESTKGKYVAIDDPKGTRTKILNAQAKPVARTAKKPTTQTNNYDHLYDKGYRQDTESTAVRNIYTPPLPSVIGKDPLTYMKEQADAKKKAVNKAVQNKNQKVKQFYKEYHESPRYSEMLHKSEPSNYSDYYWGRKFNLEGYKDQDINYPKPHVVVRHKQPTHDPNTGGFSTNNTGWITVLPKGFGVKGLLPHEWSHSTDRPLGMKTNPYTGAPFASGVRRVIPVSDQLWMMKHAAHDWYQSPEFKKQHASAKKWDWQHKNDPGFQNFLNSKTEWYDYVGKPTETRARLNDIRYQSKQKGIYDPFTEKVSPETYKKLLNTEFEKGDKEGFDALKQLKDVYTDEEIQWMLNNISHNKTTEFEENINQGFGRKGGYIVEEYNEGGKYQLDDEVDEATMRRLKKLGFTFEKI